MAGNRRDFDETLETIEAEVIELFAMIAEDLPQATAALLNGDGAVLSALAEHQQAIDALYPQMEAKISWEITRQAPVASDLRFLLSVLKIARDFERAHRSVVHIAARAHHRLLRTSPRRGGSPVLGQPPRSWCRSGDVVHRVRDLDLVAGVAAEQVAVLVAEVGHDRISLAGDVLAGAGLVFDGRAGRRVGAVQVRRRGRRLEEQVPGLRRGVAGGGQVLDRGGGLGLGPAGDVEHRVAVAVGEAD